MQIERKKELEVLLQLVRRHPVVGIIGARQVGKTTLARQLATRMAESVFYYDLENPEDLAKLSDPMLALKALKGLVIIDEIQRLPNLFSVLRVLVDQPRVRSRFLGSGQRIP